MKQRWMMPGASVARSLRALVLVLPAALAILPVSSATSAATSICQQIRLQLDAVVQTPRYDAKRLDRAIRQSRAAGCGQTGFASPLDTQCHAHARRIHDLQAFAYVPTDTARNAVRRQRAQLTAALHANGCGRRQAARDHVADAADEAGRRQAPASRRVGAPILTVDGMIPVPLARPASPAEMAEAGYAEFGATRLVARGLARSAELARPREMSAARKAVRVVGGRFLAQPDASMNFMVVATSGDNPANEVVGGLLAILESTVVSRASAAER